MAFLLRIIISFFLYIIWNYDFKDVNLLIM